MQYFVTCRKILLVLLVPLRNARIKVPAVVIKSRMACELHDFLARLLLQMYEPDDDISHLHASIVDVVLDIHFPVRESKQANERITQDCVSQMPDMRGFIGIDTRMLDENFAARSLLGGFLIGGECRS